MSVTLKPRFHYIEIGIHTGTASVRTSGSGDALDFESVRGIIETASRIRSEGRRLDNRLTVSDTTAKTVQHTFPFTAVEGGEAGDLPLYRVEMPRPVG